MNRINKYRAWNKEKKIMCYDNEDFSACYWDGAYSSEVGIINEYLNLPEHLQDYEYMQHIGVDDKNGKEIYEGDIVRVIEDFEEIYVVEWDEDIARYVLTQNGATMCDFGDIYGDDMEVVGNVYENADLLKGVDRNE